MILPIPMEYSPSFLAAEAGDLAALERLAAERTLEPDKALVGAAKAGRVDTMTWCAERGATDFDWAIAKAARGGHIEAMAWCAERGATKFDWAMACAAWGGYTEAMAWCAEKGATDFDRAMGYAARAGQTEAMAWCARYFARGDRTFTGAMDEAVLAEKYEAAELCLAWGGDINDSRFDDCNDRWAAAVRAGEIRVEPQDPLEAFQPLGPFKFYD